MASKTLYCHLMNCSCDRSVGSGVPADSRDPEYISEPQYRHLLAASRIFSAQQGQRLLGSAYCAGASPVISSRIGLSGAAQRSG